MVHIKKCRCTKVAQQRIATFGVQDVVRIQVTMQDAACVQVLRSRRNAKSHAQRGGPVKACMSGIHIACACV